MATAADTAGTAGVVGIHAIGGMAGIGKTTFAVHACHQQALATAEAIGSRREQARALEGMGRCYLHDGDLGQGAGPLHQALAIYERIGSPGVKRVADVIRDRDL